MNIKGETLLKLTLKFIGKDVTCLREKLLFTKTLRWQVENNSDNFFCDLANYHFPFHKSLRSMAVENTQGLIPFIGLTKINTHQTDIIHDFYS